MPSPKYFCVYLHCKPDGSPFYVGKGSSGRHRAFDLKHNRNRHHQNIVNKYGKENIEVLIFPRDTEKEALDDEIKWIKALKGAGEILCNLTAGGDGLSDPSDELRKLWSAQRKGRKLTQEHRAKMSAAQKERYAKHPCTNNGRKISEITKEKMRLVANARWANSEFRADFSLRMRQIFSEKKATA